MTRTHMVRAASAALALWAVAGTAPAGAQYGGGYGPRYDDRYDEERYDDERYERRRSRRYGGGRGGSVCVTARGNCIVPPAPFNSGCGCEIPGFGLKRGAIGG